MHSSFEHTLRSLDPRTPSLPGVIAAAAAAAAWGWWAARAEVGVYAQSSRARLEVVTLASRIAPEDAGRVVRAQLVLGEQVRAGTVLVELDSSVERSELAAAEVALEQLALELSALRAQIEAERELSRERARLGELAAQQASLRLQRSRASADYRRGMSEITSSLEAEHLASRIDALGASDGLAQSHLEVENARLEVLREQQQRVLAAESAEARIAELSRDAAELEAARAARRAELDTLGARLARRTLRAPIGGRVGSVAPVQVGSVVAAGEVLATIVPDGEVRVVAEFSASESAGRILPNQAARVRLDGLPWVEVGALRATVAQVALEPRDGTHRVELLIEADPATLPLAHGMTGRVDVRVAAATPWELLAQSVGAVAFGRAAASEVPGLEAPR